LGGQRSALGRRPDRVRSAELASGRWKWLRSVKAYSDRTGGAKPTADSLRRDWLRSVVSIHRHSADRQIGFVPEYYL
jgi:hypothetical protein